MATREPRRDETRQRILDIAKDLFGRDGFDGTSVKQVAAAAGLSDAALYYHFRSKREILQAIWNLPMGGGIEGVRPNGPFSQPRLDEIARSETFASTLDHSGDAPAAHDLSHRNALLVSAAFAHP